MAYDTTAEYRRTRGEADRPYLREHQLGHARAGTLRYLRDQSIERGGESRLPKGATTTVGRHYRMLPPTKARGGNWTVVNQHQRNVPRGNLGSAQQKAYVDREFARLRQLFGNRCVVCDRHQREILSPLEFAHIAETGLQSQGRGIRQRMFDIKHHPDRYRLMCHEDHCEFDKTIGPVPKSEAPLPARQSARGKGKIVTPAPPSLFVPSVDRYGKFTGMVRRTT